MDDRRVLPETYDLAEETGVTIEEAQVFLADQQRFGRVVGELRERYPDRVAHAQVMHDPPSFLVEFVGGIPPGVEDAFAGVSYPVRLSRDGIAAESELEALSLQIWQLLMAEGITNHMTAVDTRTGLVRVTVPVGFVPSSPTLRELLMSPRVTVTTTDQPVCLPQAGADRK